jgi:hypothetical protein
MKRRGFVTVATGALLSVLAGAGPAAATDARTPNNSTLAFCTALLNFDAGWPQINRLRGPRVGRSPRFSTSWSS